MPRPQLPAAHRWLLGCLLVLSTLVGTGILQGAHCIDGRGRHQAEASRPLAAAHGHDAPHVHEHGQPRAITGVDCVEAGVVDCGARPAAARGTVVSTAVYQPAGVRNARVVPASPPLPTARPQAAVVLVQIGVSRT